MRLSYLDDERACKRKRDLPPIGGEPHDQVGEPLCKLWWKVWSCLPSPLGAAVLPQSLQDQLPCKNSQGLCAHEKVVWHVSSRGDVDEEPVRRRAVVAATRSPRHCGTVSQRFPASVTLMSLVQKLAPL